MIDLRQGDLLKADAEALVNTVNCVGVMGKGIALAIRKAYPAVYEAYRRACEAGEVAPGKLLVLSTEQLFNPRYIINFPTKRHWRQPSRMEDIESGLQALVAVIAEHQLQSIALPPLGCGNGGLDWQHVRPRIEAALSQLPEVRVLLYEPAVESVDAAADDADTVSTTVSLPASADLSLAQAMLIELCRRYGEFDYRLGPPEIERLAYLLQHAGAPLEHDINPINGGRDTNDLTPWITATTDRALRRVDGAQSAATYQVLDEVAEHAQTKLADQAAAQAMVDRVTRLMEGFETPYGLQLLATLHADAMTAAPTRGELDETGRAHHHHAARQQLVDQGWLPVAATGPTR